MLPSAVGIAISPLPLIALILMLVTPNGRTNGIAFAAGWIAALGLATAALVLLGSGASTGDSTPATWTSRLKAAAPTALDLPLRQPHLPAQLDRTVPGVLLHHRAQPL